MKYSPFKRLKHNQEGAVAIEMAFILPMLMLLYFGLLDVTQYISTSRKITAVAGTIGDLVGQHSKKIVHVSASSGDFSDYFTVGTMVMKPLTDDNVRIRVAAYRLNGTDIDNVWSVNNGQGADCVNPLTDAQIRRLLGDGKDVIVSQVCSKIKLTSAHLLAFYNPGQSKFNVEHHVLVKPRSSNVECYTSSSKDSGASDCTKDTTELE